MTEPNRQSGEKEERIIEIEIERLRPFKEHPFQVKDDKEMFLLQESIEKYGILNPLIVRPVPDGYYEIISGHRRKHAAEKLGYRKVPVIIRVLSEDDSILSMVDSNLHRERISYSEKAFAYKLKNDVLKRKSGRKKSQVDHKTPRKRSIDIISEDCGDSPKQVQRYISLTKLIPEMLQKLDDEIISFCPAVEIAALKENEQRELLKAMDYAQAIDCMPSLGMMTINALVSSDSVLIPVQAAYLPVKGLQQLILTVKKRLNRKLAIEGILLTMVDFRTNYARDIASRVHTTYGSQIEVFENVIPMSVKAAETSAEGKSIYMYCPKGKVVEAYMNLTQEVLKNEK